MRDLIFFLLTTLTLTANLTFLITPNIINYSYIANSYITAGGKSIYTLVSESITNQFSIIKYDVNNGQIIPTKSFIPHQQSLVAWQMAQIEGIIAFPLLSNSKLQLFNNNSPQPYTFNENLQQYFQIINSNRNHRIFLSSFHGNIYYINKTENLVINNYNSIPDSQHFGNTFISLSPDQNYLCSTDQYTGIISIWSAHSLALLYSFQTNQTGIRSHTWNQNSLFLYVIGYTNGTLYQYDLTNGIQLSNQVFLQILSISSCFYYYQTNQIIAFSQNQSSIITISLSNNFAFQIIPTFLGAQFMNFDNSSRYFSVLSNTSISFYELKSICSSTQYFHSSNQTCLPCGFQCTCCNAFSCFTCSQGYLLSSDYWNCQYINVESFNTSNQHPSDYLNQTFFQIINITFNIINDTIQIPGHRQFLNIFFQLFSSFDHLILYIYHNRTYGPNMQNYLFKIHNTIDYRFNIIQDSICQQYLGMDFASWQMNIDFKQNYSLPKFTSIESNGQGFLVNNLQYFFINMPIIIIEILCMRLIFKLLFNYPLSSLFRKFSFTGIIVFCLLQGNTELFSFSFAANFLLIFSSNFTDKIVNANTVAAGLLYLNLATLGIFFIFLHYKKFSIYLYQNCHGFYSSAFFCMTMNGIINILRGFFHRLMINMQTEQMVVLTLVQLYQISVQMYFIKKMKIFKTNFIQVLFICANISRIVLNISLMMENIIDISTMDTIHIFVIFSTMFLFLLASVHSIIQTLSFIKRLIEISIQRLNLNKEKQRRKQKQKNTSTQKSTLNTIKAKPFFSSHKVKPSISPRKMTLMNISSLNCQSEKQANKNIKLNTNPNTKYKKPTHPQKTQHTPSDPRSALRIVFSKNPIILEQKLSHQQTQK